LQEQIREKKTSFEDLIVIFKKLSQHLRKEGVLKYESEKGYHSVIGDEVDYVQTL